MKIPDVGTYVDEDPGCRNIRRCRYRMLEQISMKIPGVGSNIDIGVQ